MWPWHSITKISRLGCSSLFLASARFGASPPPPVPRKTCSWAWRRRTARPGWVQPPWPPSWRKRGQWRSRRWQLRNRQRLWHAEGLGESSPNGPIEMTGYGIFWGAWLRLMMSNEPGFAQGDCFSSQHIVKQLNHQFWGVYGSVLFRRSEEIPEPESAQLVEIEINMTNAPNFKSGWV